MLPKAVGGAWSFTPTPSSPCARQGRLPDGHIKIVALATETAAALFVTGTFADASRRLSGLTWGAEDLSAELGARANRDAQGHFLDPYRLARVLCLAGAAAAAVPAIDTVYVDFRDSEGFERECEEACRDGFVESSPSIPGKCRSSMRCSRRARMRSPAPKRSSMPSAANPSAGVVGIGGVTCTTGRILPRKRLLARSAPAKP